MSTPSAPDVDQPDGGAHHGEPDGDGRTPDNPDNDQPDGGESGQSAGESSAR